MSENEPRQDSSGEIKKQEGTIQYDKKAKEIVEELGQEMQLDIHFNVIDDIPGHEGTKVLQVIFESTEEESDKFWSKVKELMEIKK